MKNLTGLRICFLAGTLGQGGAERQLYYNLMTLKSCGAEPYLLSFEKNGYWEKAIQALGIPVIIVGNGLSRITKLRKIINEVERISPSIFQSQHFYTNLYVMAVSRYLKFKEIGTIRSDGIHDLADMGKISGYLSLHTPRILVANTKNAIANINSQVSSNRNIFYLPNVIDLNKFPKKSRTKREEIHVTMVGRLSSPKRFDKFIEILAEARQLCSKKIIGHIVGDGPDKQMLNNLIAKLPAGFLQFHGSISDVEPIYSNSDICMHLSDWEGMPNSILEAMATGLPVIASNVGGVPEIVLDGITGYIVNPGDDNKTLSVLINLSVDAHQRNSMGQAGRLFVEKNHSLSILASFLEILYSKVLEK